MICPKCNELMSYDPITKKHFCEQHEADMETHCLKIAVTIAKNGYKNISARYGAGGMVVKVADDTDGQVYKVEITPMYYTVQTEMAHAAKNK